MAKDSRNVVVTDPDPTAAVTEALKLAVANIDGRINGLDEKIDFRFQAIDQATTLARDEYHREISTLKIEIQNAASAAAQANKELVGQLGLANSTALTAALQTQEKSAAKSEGALTELLKQQQINFATAVTVINDKIDRLTSRFDLSTASTTAADTNRRDSRDESHSNRTQQTALIAIGVTIILAFVAYALGFHK
jgi:hypothetical protein